MENNEKYEVRLAILQAENDKLKDQVECFSNLSEIRKATIEDLSAKKRVSDTWMRAFAYALVILAVLLSVDIANHYRKHIECKELQDQLDYCNYLRNVDK